MGTSLNHPIVDQSFAIIDQEIGTHSFTPDEYAVVRRVIHSTADFDFKHLVRFSGGAIAHALALLKAKTPIITDVTMVSQGIQTLVAKTFQNPVHVAVQHASTPLPGRTLTETGMLRCLDQYPDGIFVIGNAPTALLALCHHAANTEIKPSLVIGAPVGFVSVVESKETLRQSGLPQIRVEGRKGGSAVAAAIVNALLVLAWSD